MTSIEFDSHTFDYKVSLVVRVDGIFELHVNNVLKEKKQKQKKTRKPLLQNFMMFMLAQIELNSSNKHYKRHVCLDS